LNVNALLTIYLPLFIKPNDGANIDVLIFGLVPRVVRIHEATELLETLLYINRLSK
jgi:hypothetical protein